MKILNITNTLKNFIFINLLLTSVTCIASDYEKNEGELREAARDLLINRKTPPGQIIISDSGHLWIREPGKNDLILGGGNANFGRDAYDNNPFIEFKDEEDNLDLSGPDEEITKFRLSADDKNLFIHLDIDKEVSANNWKPSASLAGNNSSLIFSIKRDELVKLSLGKIYAQKLKNILIKRHLDAMPMSFEDHHMMYGSG